MTTDEIKYEPLADQKVEQETESVIELERYLISLREKKLPLQQQVNLINYEIEQTKSKIKIQDRIYWSNKGK